jgi:putative transposase
LEDLQVKALADSYLSKDVRDAAWRQFIGILTDKAEEAGRIVVLVDPRNTSQTCSACGRLPAERKKLSALERLRSPPCSGGVMSRARAMDSSHC